MIQAFFTKRKVVIFFILLIFLYVEAVYAACNVEFEWTPNPESYVQGYKIHYGTSQGGPYDHVFDAGKPTPVNNKMTATLTGLSNGTWYFVATAYDSEYESEYSQEVSFVCQDDSGDAVVTINYSPNPVNNPKTDVTFVVNINPELPGSVTYEWNFDDGNTATVTSSIITHKFETSKTYNVQLTLTNEDGSTIIKTIPIEVQDNLPAVPANLH